MPNFIEQFLLKIGLLSRVFAAITSISLYNPLGTTSLTAVVDKIINFLLQIGIPVAVVMVLVGGFQMIVSAGNPDKVSSGKKTILYAAIGLVVLLAAKSIIVIIENILGVK